MREQRLIFGEVAELYDKARAAYPEQLVGGSPPGSTESERRYAWVLLSSCVPDRTVPSPASLPLTSLVASQAPRSAQPSILRFTLRTRCQRPARQAM